MQLCSWNHTYGWTLCPYSLPASPVSSFILRKISMAVQFVPLLHCLCCPSKQTFSQNFLLSTVCPRLSCLLTLYALQSESSSLQSMRNILVMKSSLPQCCWGSPCLLGCSFSVFYPMNASSSVLHWMLESPQAQSWTISSLTSTFSS